MDRWMDRWIDGWDGLGKDAFTLGSLERFIVGGAMVGTLHKILVKHNGPKVGSRWFLEWYFGAKCRSHQSHVCILACAFNMIALVWNEQYAWQRWWIGLDGRVSIRVLGMNEALFFGHYGGPSSKPTSDIGPNAMPYSTLVMLVKGYALCGRSEPLCHNPSNAAP